MLSDLYTQFNYLHQCYLDPMKITKMFGGREGSCPRCGSTRASFFHMVWECGVIANFWARVVAHINRALHRRLKPNPGGCLLGMLERPSPHKADNKAMDLALATARKSIAGHWKSARGPSYEGWAGETAKWFRAEEELILREERMGIRLKILSPRWKEVAEAFAEAVEGRDASESESD